MTYTFTVPNYLPPSLNALIGRHWRRLHQAKKEAAALLEIYSRLAGVPVAPGKRRVTLAFAGARSDADNRLKVVLDALVRCGLLIDDSPKWCVLDGFANAPGPRATTVTLEDLP